MAKFEKFDFTKIVLKKKEGTDEEIEDFDDTVVDGGKFSESDNGFCVKLVN